MVLAQDGWHGPLSQVSSSLALWRLSNDLNRGSSNLCAQIPRAPAQGAPQDTEGHTRGLVGQALPCWAPGHTGPAQPASLVRWAGYLQGWVLAPAGGAQPCAQAWGRWGEVPAPPASQSPWAPFGPLPLRPHFRCGGPGRGPEPLSPEAPRGHPQPLSCPDRQPWGAWAGYAGDVSGRGQGWNRGT